MFGFQNVKEKKKMKLYSDHLFYNYFKLVAFMFHFYVKIKYI